jgi:hypothetical protein
MTAVLKVKVEYTEEFDAEDLAHYSASVGHTCPQGRNALRSELRQVLEDIGRMGVEERLVDGMPDEVNRKG